MESKSGAATVRIASISPVKQRVAQTAVNRRRRPLAFSTNKQYLDLKLRPLVAPKGLSVAASQDVLNDRAVSGLSTQKKFGNHKQK